MQAALEDAPRPLKNVRVGHALHAPEPASVLNVPATQGEHVSRPPAPVWSGTHSHSLTELPPTADCVRFGHALHVTAPAASENVFAGHSSHTVDPFAPVKLLGAHSLHGAVPVVCLYVPTPHAMQLLA